MLGTSKSLSVSSGAKADPSPFFGGVRGSVRQNAARAKDAMADTRNVLVRADSMAAPVLGVPRRLTQPRDHPAGLRDGGHLGPVDRDKDERPAHGDPADRAPDADEAKVFLGVFDIGKRDRIGDRHGRHIEKAVDEHDDEHRPECSGVDQAEHGDPADQVADRQVLGLLEVTVSELPAKKPRGQRRISKGIDHPGGLISVEVEIFRQVESQERQPRAQMTYCRNIMIESLARIDKFIGSLASECDGNEWAADSWRNVAIRPECA